MAGVSRVRWIAMLAAFGIASTACIAAQPATAAGADGTYGCADVTGIALGLLSISGSSYTWTKTDTGFRPQQANENGSGTVRFDGNYFVPVTGPMASWNVTGAVAANGININNNGGNLMGCRRR